MRVDLGGDADELALALEERDPLAQVVGGIADQSTEGRIEGGRAAGAYGAACGVLCPLPGA